MGAVAPKEKNTNPYTALSGTCERRCFAMSCGSSCNAVKLSGCCV